MEQITAKEIADFILGLNALIICLALPCWFIGSFLDALFYIIDQLQASIDNKRFRKRFEKAVSYTHLDVYKRQIYPRLDGSSGMVTVILLERGS